METTYRSDVTCVELLMGIRLDETRFRSGEDLEWTEKLMLE